MSFSVPRFPAMPYHRTIIEHWTYRWDQESQRYIRATYRPLSVDEPMDNPREVLFDDSPPSAAGLPQEETASTQTSARYTGIAHHPEFVVPVLPIVSSPPLRPPAPSARSPITIRPNTSLGQTYFMDGTVTAPTPGSSTGATEERGRSRKRTGPGAPDQSGGSPPSRPRWVSPPRAPLPDSPASPDPSPPQSPRTSPTILVPDSPPPSPPLLPAPDRPAPPPPSAFLPAPERPAPSPHVVILPDHDTEASDPPSSAAPDTQPDAPLEIPEFSVTVINGDSSRTFTSGTSGASSSSSRPNFRRTIRIVNGRVNGSQPMTTTIPAEAAPPGNPPNRSRSRSRSLNRTVRIADQETFVYDHSRDPQNPRRHLTIVPSWGTKVQDKRGQCVVCLEENAHLQIKCKSCSTQRTCCQCIVGIYRYINPCPMCRHRGEE